MGAILGALLLLGFLAVIGFFVLVVYVNVRDRKAAAAAKAEYDAEVDVASKNGLPKPKPPGLDAAVKDAVNYHNRRYGFTIIELLVVIAIIAILASIVMPFVVKLGSGKSEVVRREAVGPPSPPRPVVATSPTAVTLTIQDKTLAAEVVNLATNQGHTVVWLNPNSAVLTR